MHKKCKATSPLTGGGLGVGNTPLLRKGSEEPPFLVNKFVVFCAEARQSDAIAIASFGYDVENLKFWFLIVLHSRNFLEVIQMLEQR